MTTIFSAPQINDPRAAGIKNGGVKAFESDIVYPVSRLRSQDGTWSGGKQMEFRWRSDSSRFFSPRDTKLCVKYKVAFGPSMTQAQEQIVALDTEITSAGGGFVPGAVVGTTPTQIGSEMTPAAASFKRVGVIKQHTDHSDKAFTIILDDPETTFLKVVDSSNAATENLAFLNDAGTLVSYSIGTANIVSISAVSALQAVDLSTPDGKDEVRNVRLTAAPNTSLFDGGVRYLQNSVTVENQTQPYTAAMAQLLTKSDVASSDTGVAGLLSLRKDVGKSLGAGAQFAGAEARTVDFAQAGTSTTLRLRSDVTANTTLATIAGDGGNVGDITLGGLFRMQNAAGDGLTNGVIRNIDIDLTGSQVLPGGDGGADNKFDNTNPKQEILTLGDGTFEVAEPLFLACWQHGYAVGPSDHQLFLTVNPEFANDLFYCPPVKRGVGSGLEEFDAMPRDYIKVVHGALPTGAVGAAGGPERGAVYVQIESVELHVAYMSPAQAFIPPSQSLRFSEYHVTTRQLKGTTSIQESIVVPPGVRQVIVGLRQNKHGISYDREELSKAGGGINEIPKDEARGQGVRLGGVGSTDDEVYWWKSFQLQLGSAIAPTVAFSELDPMTDASRTYPPC